MNEREELVRAAALREAADELDRLARISQTPVRDLTVDDEADYKAFLEAGSVPGFLRSLADKL